MPEPFSGTARVHADRVELSLSVPIRGPRSVPPADPAAEGPPEGKPGKPWHSADFSCVRWGDQTHAFTRKQRTVVAALWRATEQGHGWVLQETLLELAESDCLRLRDLFRGHLAWGEMIVPAVDDGGPPGSFKLGGDID